MPSNPLTLTPCKARRLIDILIELDEPMSIRNISRRLKVNISDLGRLCGILEKAGLIQAVGTENGEHGGKGVIWESAYRVTRKA